MYVVIINSEIPGAIGPFRSYARACNTADTWNATTNTEERGYAWVQRLVRSADQLPD